MSTHYGPVVPVRTQMRIAPWLLLAVALWGYCTDHNVHSARGFVVAVVRDLSGLAQQRAGKPPADAGPYAKADIPRAYLVTYQRAAKSCPGLSWAVLAGIGKVETNHGRSSAPGVRSGVNAFGCCAGPMQFNIRNGPPSTWDAYGRGGNVYDSADAIPAAMRLLCANGARGGRDLRGAIYAYNHSSAYVADVSAWAKRYRGGSR